MIAEDSERSLLVLPFYILSLGVSAGLVGVFGRRLLALEGFVPDFQVGLILTAGIACAYLALQFLYVALLRFLKPSRDGAPLLCEASSHAAALILIPHLLNVPIPWPYGILVKVEPLIYLGIFGALHGLFKLMSLFAALRSRPAHRLAAIGWLAACALSLYGASVAFPAWYTALRAARITEPGPLEPYQIGHTWAMARRVAEGAVVNFDIRGHEGHTLTLRWASPPDQEKPPQQIEVTVQPVAKGAQPCLLTVALNGEGWAEATIPPQQIPDAAETCAVLWNRRKEPEWVTQTGLRPMPRSNETMLLSGPYRHRPEATLQTPNILLIVLEGLGAGHVTGMGYARETTPALRDFAASAIAFHYACSPAPEAAAACMTLLTGCSPLRHGYLGARQGPLPETIQMLPEMLQSHGYATAAFTEGDGPEQQDLSFGAGFERGFELFDPAYPLAKSKRSGALPGPASQIHAGSRVTLSKAAAWIEAHCGRNFMVFVRLAELRKPRRLSRYGPGYAGQRQSPPPVDVYDTALADVDKQLGSFLERIQELPATQNTCIVITSPYGLDFSGGRRAEGKRRLTEPSLRVPLLLSIPGRSPIQRVGPISLEDLAPTLLVLAGLRVPEAVTGADLMAYIGNREPISMMGDPLELSIRTAKWRLNWQSGRSPFQDAAAGKSAILSLLDITRYYRGLPQRDYLREEPELAERLRNRLAKYLDEHAHAAESTVAIVKESQTGTGVGG